MLLVKPNVSTCAKHWNFAYVRVASKLRNIVFKCMLSFVFEKVTLYLSLFGIPQIPANHPLGLYLKFNFLFLLWSNALLFYMDCHPLFLTLDELILISWQNCFVFNVFQEFLLRSLFTRIPDQLFQSFSWDPWKEFRDFVFEIILAFLWFCYSFLVIFFCWISDDFLMRF